MLTDLFLVALCRIIESLVLHWPVTSISMFSPNVASDFPLMGLRSRIYDRTETLQVWPIFFQSFHLSTSVPFFSLRNPINHYGPATMADICITQDVAVRPCQMPKSDISWQLTWCSVSRTSTRPANIHQGKILQSVSAILHPWASLSVVQRGRSPLNVG